MRTAAAVFAALACTVYGAYLRTGLMKRVRVLRELYTFLREAHTRILCLREPFPQMLASCAESFPALPFLRDCTAACAAGAALPEAWCAAVRRFLRTCPLTKEEAKLLSACVPALAAADAQRIAETLALYTENVQMCVRRAEAQQEAWGKLCIRVCGAVGVLLGILIL